MDIEANYGRCIAVYEGQGRLVFKKKKEVECNFEVGQLLDGTIILLCSSVAGAYFPFDTPELAAFTGTTVDGFGVKSEGRISEMTYLPNKNVAGSWLACRIDRLVVTMSNNRSKTARFGITNYKFSGSRFNVSKYSTRELPLVLSTGRNISRLKIRLLEDYKIIMRRVQTLKSIEVTCEAAADIRINGGIKTLEVTIDNLCRLSSVSRGTKIQWVYCDLYDNNDLRIKRVHAARITKPYCPMTVIDYRTDDGETKRFLEKSYNTYVERCVDYKLDKGTIDAYLDAKAEEDYLETRAAKLAVALEKIKNAFLKLPTSSVSEFIVDESLFEGCVPRIRSEIDKALIDAGIVDKGARDAIANENKIRGMNRRAFSYAIKKLCTELGLTVSQREVSLFIQCRNKLVHQGEFYAEAATPEERTKCKPLATAREEYYFMVNFLDRIFLKLFGYSGEYINYLKFMTGKPERETLP